VREGGRERESVCEGESGERGVEGERVKEAITACQKELMV